MADPDYVADSNRPGPIEQNYPAHTNFVLKEYEWPYETPGGWNTMVTWGIQVNLISQTLCDLAQSVSLDSYNLNQQNNECYYVFSHPPNVSGYYMDEFPLIWTVLDTNSNELFSMEDYTAKPTVNSLLAPGDHSLNSDLTIYFNFENVDSCKVYLGKVEKKLDVNSTACTFTPGEMATLQCGKAYLTFALFNYSDTLISGESISMMRSNIIQRNFVLNP